MSKHYNLRFYPKLGHGICEICHIPCACVGYKQMLENIGFLVFCQRNRPATNLSPTAIIGQFWTHIKMEYHWANTKTNTFWGVWWDTSGFSWVNKWKLASLVQSGMYVSINTYETTTNVLYVIQFLSEDNVDVTHKYVKMYCDTNQFPELSFCGPYPKPHGSRGLSKNYHLRFYPKLGHGICAVCRIPNSFISCT